MQAMGFGSRPDSSYMALSPEGALVEWRRICPGAPSIAFVLLGWNLLHSMSIPTIREAHTGCMNRSVSNLGARP